MASVKEAVVPDDLYEGFPAQPTTPALARAAIVKYLAREDSNGSSLPPRSLVSELVTNAVVHAGEFITLRAQTSTGCSTSESATRAMTYPRSATSPLTEGEASASSTHSPPNGASPRRTATAKPPGSSYATKPQHRGAEEPRRPAPALSEAGTPRHSASSCVRSSLGCRASTDLGGPGRASPFQHGQRGQGSCASCERNLFLTFSAVFFRWPSLGRLALAFETAVPGGFPRGFLDLCPFESRAAGT